MNNAKASKGLCCYQFKHLAKSHDALVFGAHGHHYNCIGSEREPQIHHRIIRIQIITTDADRNHSPGMTSPW